MNTQNQEKILARITKGYYRKTTLAAIATLIMSLCIICYLLGIKFRFNTEYDYDFRALVASAGLSITSFIAALYLDKKKLHLFPTIILWVLLGLFSYTLLSAIWGSGEWPDRLFSGWHRIEGNRLDQVKTILTTIGGIGGVGYLVIKYRERSASERGEADEKLLHAVQQLGDRSAQVRIAGVYALADVADTYGGAYPQRAVDILCGYLKTNRIQRNESGNALHETTDKDDEIKTIPFNKDQAIESAILQVLAEHLRTTRLKNINTRKNPPIDLSIEVACGPGVWSSCKLDLHGATLTEPVNLSDCYIRSLNMQNVTLYNRLSLSNSHIVGRANFDSANFKQEANFEGTHFEFPASFDSVTFEKDARFNKSVFSYMSSFESTEFAESAWFENANFSIIGFIKTRFYGDAHFKGIHSSVPMFYDSEFHQLADFSTKSLKDNTPKDYNPDWLQHGDLYRNHLREEYKDIPDKANEVRFIFDGAMFNSKLKNTNTVTFPDYDESLFINGFPPKEVLLPLGASWTSFDHNEKSKSDTVSHGGDFS